MANHEMLSDAGDFALLRQNALFRGMSEGTVTNVGADIQVIEFPSGREVLVEGEESDSVDRNLYLVLSGSIRISRSVPDSRSEILAILGPSEFFGEMALAEGETRSAMAVTTAQSKIGIIGRPVFERLCVAEPLLVVENLVRTLGSRLRTMNDAVIATRVRQLKLATIGSVVQEIAHDLKSPLSIVVGVADMIEMGIAKPESAKMLRRSSQVVLGLVEDILAFAANKPRRPHAPFAVKDLVANIEDFGLAPIEHNQRISVRRTYDYEGEMIGDRVSIERALLNLIKNANEAMSSGGALEVAISLVGNRVRFIVADSGVGIPQSVQEKLFSPFVTSGKLGGTGLGLSMVKRTVDEHGGTVDVESGPKGTRFVIELPQRTLS